MVSRVMMLLGAITLLHGAYIPIKGHVAQLLIHYAWNQSKHQGQSVKAWRWADTHPIAKLSASTIDRSYVVLAGASGEAMAFGPAHVSASALPGADGHVVIGGHRDTHFEFLQHMTTGDELTLEDIRGVQRTYEVIATRVANVLDGPFIPTHERNLLTLITCYPFDAIASGGSLRWVVTAEERT